MACYKSFSEINRKMYICVPIILLISHKRLYIPFTLPSRVRNVETSSLRELSLRTREPVQYLPGAICAITPEERFQKAIF